MTYMEILEKFAEYCNYDREETRFNLLSSSYEMHVTCKTIETILSEYDMSGMLAVIYAKIRFSKLLKEKRISAFDAIANPASYQEEKIMWEMFSSAAVSIAENDFIEKLNQIYLKVTEGKLIGEDDGQREQLLDSIEDVVGSISKCRIDMFAKGGKIQKITNVNTNIHVFETLAECLLALENSQDGIYLCFINANGTADCFFGFFLKSNGTIIAVHDRVDESYIGQHENSRNGRWTEAKVDAIFPYDYVFNYSQYDYKGYAKKYMIDENKLNIYNLGIEGFMPLVIGMLLILLKFTEKELDLPLVYLDSFLPDKREQIESHELMEIGNSSLVLAHNDVDLSFDNEKIISGSYSKEFGEGNYNQMMVELWGECFKADTQELFPKSNIKYLANKDESSKYVPEFVGSENRIRSQAYMVIRQQLANYMEDRIYEYWKSNGGTKPVIEWYKKAVAARKEFLYSLIYNFDEEIKDEYNESDEEDRKFFHRRTQEGISIYRVEGDDCDHDVFTCMFFDCTHRIDSRSGKEKWICDLNDRSCNLWFVFHPKNWEHLEYLTGIECPKIVKGWKSDGHSVHGNPILHATDAVEAVGTPFEHITRWYSNDERVTRWEDANFNFMFAFGYSKRAWNRLKKEIKEKRKGV